MGTIFLILSFIGITLFSLTLCYAKDICDLFLKPEIDKPNTIQKFTPSIITFISLILCGLILFFFLQKYNSLFSITIVVYFLILLIANIFTKTLSDSYDKFENIMTVNAIIVTIVAFILILIPTFLCSNDTKQKGETKSKSIYIECNSLNKNNTTVNLATVGKNKMELYFIASSKEKNIEIPTTLSKYEYNVFFIEENEPEKLIISKKHFEEYTWIYKNNIPKKDSLTEEIEYNFFIRPSSIRIQ